MNMNKSFFLILASLLFLLFSSFAFGQDNLSVEVDLPDSYKSVSPGEEIWFTVKAANPRSMDDIDITLNYQILNSNDVVISSKSQTLAIGTQASFVESISVPENVPLGSYTLKVILFPIGSEAEHYSQIKFRVVAKAIGEETFLNIYFFLVFLSVMGILAYIIQRLKPLFKKIMVQFEVYRIVKNKLAGKKKR